MDRATTESSRSSVLAVVFAVVREALDGSHRDLTTGNLRRAIVILAIPMILEMVMESLFGVVDMFFVARLGVDSLATVALTESVLVLVFGIALGLSMATTAFVARRIGEKDTEGAAVGAVQAIALGLLLSGVCGRLRDTLRARTVRLMGATEAVVAGRYAVHADSAGRVGHHISAVPDQRRISAARATRRSPCACSGSRTASTSCWTRA